MTDPHLPRPLTALRERFAAGRTPITDPDTGVPAGSRYPLNATAFPAGLPEQAEQVAATLTACFGGAITIAATAEPDFTEDGSGLRLTGVLATPLLGVSEARCTFVATVEGSFLRGELTLTLPVGWSWGHTFGALAGEVPDGVRFHDASLTASTRSDAPTGLRFEGRTPVPAELGGPSSVRDVTLRGVVGIVGERPRFVLESTERVDRIVVNRAGQRPLTLTDLVVTLRTTPPVGDDGAAGNVSAFVAHGRLDGNEVEVDLPAAWAGPLTLRAQPSTVFPTVGSALAAMDIPPAVLTALRSLPVLSGNVTIQALTVTFDPNGVGATRTEVIVAAPGSSWPVVSLPPLSVPDPTLTLVVTRNVRPARAPSEPKITFTAVVTGTVTLGGPACAVEVRFGARPPATLVLGGAAPLGTVAAVSGFTAEDVRSALPPTFVHTLDGISADVVALDVDLSTTIVTRALVRFSQAAAWPIGGVLELTGWAVTLVLNRAGDGWWAAGRINGSVVVGGVELEVELWVPATTDWSLALAKNEVIHIPAFSDLLAPLGHRTGGLPTGLKTLGGVDITSFRVSVDAYGQEVTQVVVGLQQVAAWTIIPDALIVSDLDALVTVDIHTGIAAWLSGTVTLGGLVLDARLIKTPDDDGWLLEIGRSKPMVFPGFDALDAWLGPDAVRGYLPGTLPLSEGFELWDVGLRFDGGTGSLVDVAFVLAVPDLWTVVPGRLALTDVRAVVRAYYPITPRTVTGTVRAILTLAGAEIVLSAAKPSGAEPWVFTGELVKEATFDLVAAANSVSADLFSLPGDITSFDGAFPDAVILRSVHVRAVPDTGAFHLDGLASFEWHPTIGGATLDIDRISGTVDVAGTGEPVVVTLAGSLTYAGLRVDVGARIGTASTPTILTGATSPADLPDVRLPALADGTGAEERWADLLPRDFVAPSLETVAVWANLSGAELLLYGRLSGFHQFALLSEVGADGARSYAVVVELAPGFRFDWVFGSLSIDDYVRVQAARLIVANRPGDTVGALAGRIARALAAAAPDRRPPLADLARSADPLPAGALFTAELDVRFTEPGTLLGSLLAIGGGPAPSIRLTAVIDRVDSARTLFVADLADITLFGGSVRIIRSSTAPAVRLTYRPAALREFTLDARVEVAVFGSVYGFDVALKVDDDELTTVAALVPTAQSVVPFGLPGLRIDALTLDAQIRFAPRLTAIRLTGQVRIGSVPFAAALTLFDGVPALVLVTLDEPLSIASFLGACLTGDGAAWGSSVDVVLRRGSRIYYYRADADPSHSAGLLDGYHLDAEITLRLVTEITVRALITVRTGPDRVTPLGVTAAVELPEPVDLVFVQLAGTERANESHYLGGPSLRFSTGETASFGFATGVNLLGAAFGSVTVDLSRESGGAHRFTGRLRAERDLVPFGRPTLDFVYRACDDPRENTLTLNGWPGFDWERNLIDVVRAIGELADDLAIVGCTGLLSIAAQRMVTSSWTMTPDVESDGGDLVFSVAGEYRLTVTGQHDPFVTVPFPRFAVRIPSTTPYRDLPEALATGLADASANLVRELLNDPYRIAVFAAVVFGGRAVDYALALACAGLVDRAVPAAAGAGATALGGGAATAAAIGAVGAAVSAALLAGGDGGGGNGGGGSDTTPAVPAIARFDYQAGAFHLDWSVARYASGYEVELRASDDSLLHEKTYGAGDWPLSLTWAVEPAAVPTGVVTGFVQAVRSGLRSAFARRVLTKPASPPATLAYRDGSLVATWSIESGIGYEVAFADPAGRPLPWPSGGNSVPLADPQPGRYTVRVRTTGGDIQADWGPAGSVTPVVLPAPAGVAVRSLGDSLSVTFDAVPGAEDHLVEVREADGAVFTTGTVAAQPGTSGARLTLTLSASSGARYRPGTPYTIRIRARRSDGVGGWSAPVVAEYDARSFTLSNRLPEAPGDAESAVLHIEISEPAGTAPLMVAPGATVRLGNGPAAKFVIRRSKARAPGLRDAERFTVEATSPGGELRLDFTGTMEGAGVRSARTTGFAFADRTLWTDVVPVDRMASPVFDVLGPERLAEALRAVYPGLTLPALLRAVLVAVRDPHAVLGIVGIAQRDVAAACTLLPVVSDAFGDIAAPLGLSMAVLAVCRGAGLTPDLPLAPFVEASFDSASEATDRARSLAVARGLGLAGFSATETALLLEDRLHGSGAAVLDRATAIAAALRAVYEDPPIARTTGYAARLAGLDPAEPGLRWGSLPAPVVLDRLRDADPQATPAVLADALLGPGSGWPLLVTWALLETGVPSAAVTSWLRQVRPANAEAFLAATLDADSEPAGVAFAAETCSPLEAARRHRAALGALAPLRAAFVFAHANGMGLARPAVLAGCLLVAGHPERGVSDALSGCFPQLTPAAAASALAEATALKELYR